MFCDIKKIDRATNEVVHNLLGLEKSLDEIGCGHVRMDEARGVEKVWQGEMLGNRLVED